MKRTSILVGLIFITVSLLFFYPIFKGKIPFPGDLLVGYYGPYNTNSYNGYLPSGVPHKAQGPDVIRQLFPWKSLVVESFKNFEIPFWNPYFLSGNPLMANFQSGSFYPLNLIFFTFNFMDAWTIFIILIPILAGFFMYAFLKELGLKISSSIFAGVVFAFSSYMVVWMEYGNVGHTFLWLPLTLLILEKFVKKQRLIHIMYFITISAIAFLAGYIQGYFYAVLVGTIYFLGRSILLKRLSKRSIVLFAVSLIFPMFLFSFQLLPTVELFGYSSRESYTLDQIDNLLNPVWYLITVIVPNFFGHPAARNSWFYGTYIERVSYFGLIPFIFSIYALFNIKKRKELIIFGGLFLGSLFLATNFFFNKFIYLIPFPFISTTVPTRILSIFVFCGSILAGYGLEFFQDRKSWKKILTTNFAILGTIASLWIFVFLSPMILSSPAWASNLSIAKRNLVLPTLFSILFLGTIYVHFKFKNAKNIVLISLFIITFIDLFYFFHKITPFSPKEYVYPKTDVIGYLKDNGSINRFWGYGSGSIENNFSTFERIYSADGYEPLHIKRYGELVSASKDGNVADLLSRSDVNIQGGYKDADLKENLYRQRILNLLGVKYILNKRDDSQIDKAFPPEIYSLIWQKASWQIYENINALPRVFLASEYIVEKDKDKIIKMIFDNKLNLRDKLILEEEVSPKINFSKDNNATVAIEEYTPNKIVLKTEASENMLLFISDNYYPGWKVRIDAEFGKIYRADYSLRAVPVTKGSHEVIFSYYPDSFDLGLKISLITFASLILLTILSKLKNYYVKK